MNLTPAPSLHYDADIFAKKRGGGAASFIGIPFLLFGLLGIAAPFTLDPTAPRWFSLAGIPIALLGVGLIFGRYGFILDRRRSMLTKWWGLIVPLKTTEIRFSSLERVLLCLGADQESRQRFFFVMLAVTGGRHPIQIDSAPEYAAAREVAERIATLTGQPLEDSTSGELIVRDPGHLDESLQDRLNRTRTSLASPYSPPPKMRTDLLETSEGLELAIPDHTFLRLRAIPILFILPVLVIFSFEVIRHGGDPLRLFPVAIVVLVAIVGPLRKLLRSNKQSTRVKLTRAALRVQGWENGKAAVTEIPLDELTDLTVPTMQSVIERMGSAGPPGTPGMSGRKPVPRFLVSLVKRFGSPGITAQSRKATVTFGRGLDEVEAAYLHAKILKFIAGR